MSPLHSEERRALLELARQMIRAAVIGGPEPVLPAATGGLAQVCGVFVSLHRCGHLRGCIGQVETPDPLPTTVARCAVGAALKDTRFDPVQSDEVASLEIEISVLSPLNPIRPEEVEVGQHGLLVRRGARVGLLLPQVATQYNWTRERFLSETCRKAGLDPEAWKEPGTRLEAFTAEVFSEGEMQRKAVSGDQ